MFELFVGFRLGWLGSILALVILLSKSGLVLDRSSLKTTLSLPCLLLPHSAAAGFLCIQRRYFFKRYGHKNSRRDHHLRRRLLAHRNLQGSRPSRRQTWKTPNLVGLCIDVPQVPVTHIPNEEFRYISGASVESSSSSISSSSLSLPLDMLSSSDTSASVGLALSGRAIFMEILVLLIIGDGEILRRIEYNHSLKGLPLTDIPAAAQWP